jgi:hypothetical protein
VAPATRFADCPAWAARALLALLLLVSAYGAAITARAPGASAEAVVDLTDTDIALYKAIAARVGAGESYYRSAAAEQRARGYPLKPDLTVRLPTLAWIVGLLGEAGATLVLKLLMISALLAFGVRLKAIAGSRRAWIGASVLAACGMVLLTVPAMTYWHESWAILLIALSLTLRTNRNWLPSVVLGLAAVLVRELALPYLALMAFFAWREGNRVEAAAWAASILIFFAAMWSHSAALAPYVTAADPSSQGWSGAGGWPFVLGMMERCSLFLFLSLPAIALLVPLALFGWASVRHPLAERVALLLFGYVGVFTILGRPDNFYWGILIAPLLPVGLAFAPRALRDLGGSLQILNPGAGRVTG